MTGHDVSHEMPSDTIFSLYPSGHVTHVIQFSLSANGKRRRPRLPDVQCTNDRYFMNDGTILACRLEMGAKRNDTIGRQIIDIHNKSLKRKFPGTKNRAKVVHGRHIR